MNTNTHFANPLAAEILELIRIGVNSHILYEDLMSAKVAASADGDDHEAQLWAVEVSKQVQAHEDRIKFLASMTGLTTNTVCRLFQPYAGDAYVQSQQAFINQTMREIGCAVSVVMETEEEERAMAA